MTEAIKKIREGLTLLINGLLEDTIELSLNYDLKNRIAKEIINHRINELERYIEKANIYEVPEKDLANLTRKYKSIKHLKSK